MVKPRERERERDGPSGGMERRIIGAVIFTGDLKDISCHFGGEKWLQLCVLHESVSPRNPCNLSVTWPTLRCAVLVVAYPLPLSLSFTRIWSFRGRQKQRKRKNKWERSEFDFPFTLRWPWTHICVCFFGLAFHLLSPLVQANYSDECPTVFDFLGHFFSAFSGQSSVTQWTLLPPFPCYAWDVTHGQPVLCSFYPFCFFFPFGPLFFHLSPYFYFSRASLSLSLSLSSWPAFWALRVRAQWSRKVTRSCFDCSLKKASVRSLK